MDNKIDFKELYDKLYQMPADEFDDAIFKEGFYGDRLEFVTMIKELMMQKKQEQLIQNEKY